MVSVVGYYTKWYSSKLRWKYWVYDVPIGIINQLITYELHYNCNLLHERQSFFSEAYSIFSRSHKIIFREQHCEYWAWRSPPSYDMFWCIIWKQIFFQPIAYFLIYYMRNFLCKNFFFVRNRYAQNTVLIRFFYFFK